MASRAKRLEANVDGDFFVDSTCIDCATCRWMAPEVFDAHRGKSRVHRQPDEPLTTARSLQALVACPTGSIGTSRRHDVSAAADAFPVQLEGATHHLGYHSRDSFGAASYLVVRPQGNVMVDVPRFNRRLIRGIEALGGVALIFLTHRDDVADHRRWAERFGCERMIHADDVTDGTRDVERVLEGVEPVDLDEDLRVVITPGHTEGSMCLIHEQAHLFSGDHLAYNPRYEHPIAFRRACWFDWATQIESMERLAQERFAHVFPGHGHPGAAPAGQMPRQMRACLQWMRERQ